MVNEQTYGIPQVLYGIPILTATVAVSLWIGAVRSIAQNSLKVIEISSTAHHGLQL